MSLRQRKLHRETPAVVDLWDGDKPKDEEDFSNYVKRHLEEDLRNLGVLAAREAEVSRGSETDIYVAAIAHNALSGRHTKINVVVEAKGCWHPQLQGAMKNQLKERYLAQGGCGLYLVGWFLCEKWRQSNDYRYERTPKWTLEKARTFFGEQAELLSDGNTNLKAYVLDAGLR